jgi:hypothetical protein
MRSGSRTRWSGCDRPSESHNHAESPTTAGFHHKLRRGRGPNDPAEYLNLTARAVVAEATDHAAPALGQAHETDGLIEDGGREAVRLIAEVDIVLRELARRTRLRWWKRMPLAQKDLRLYRFLQGTVDPSSPAAAKRRHCGSPSVASVSTTSPVSCRSGRGMMISRNVGTE